MLEIIDQLNNAATVEESLQIMMDEGSFYGGIKFSELEYIETLSGTWWDLVEADPRLLAGWIESKDPIDKSGPIWKVKETNGDWQEICWAFDIIGTIGHRYQYNTDPEMYINVWRGSSINFYLMLTPLITACDFLWHSNSPDDILLVEAVCEYIEKHKEWLKKTDYEFDLHMNADNYRHAGEVLDCWSQCNDIDIDNPTGYHVVRAPGYCEHMKNPRTEMPKEKTQDGKSHKLPKQEL